MNRSSASSSLTGEAAASDISEEVVTKEQARSEQEQLAAAIEGFPEAVVLFDADDRLVVANRAWRDFNEAAADVTHPGTPWKDYIRGLMDLRLLPQARGREEDWLRERLEKRRNPSGPYEFARTDDSWITINDHRLPDGGLLTVASDITELKQAERRLKESEERFRDYAMASSDWFWETDAAHRFTYHSEYNDPAIDAMNRSAKGKTRFELRLPDDTDDEKWDLHQADLAARRSFRNFEYPRENCDGTRRYMRVSGLPIFSDDETFVGYRGTVSDITDQKMVELALLESEARFRDFAESGSDWFWETDAEHRFSRFAGHETMVTNDPEKRGLGKTRFDMRLPDDDDDANWDAHRADLDGHRHFRDFVFPLEADDGSTHYIRVSGKPVFSDDGEFLGHRGTASDITSFVEADERARLAHSRLMDAIESLQEGFVLIDSDDRLVMTNTRFQELYGELAHLYVPGTTFEDIIRGVAESGLVAEARGREDEWIRKRLERHKNPGPPFERRLGPDLCMLMSENKTSDGGTVSVLTDITELKKAEGALKTLNEELEQRVEERTRDLADKTALLEATFESISEGFALYDEDDRLVFCNQIYRDRVEPTGLPVEPGLRYEDVTRANVERDLFKYPGETPEEKIAWRMARHRNPSGNIELRQKDGKWVLSTERKTSNGGTALVFADITDLKRREAELVQAREQADAASQAKSEFLSRMSHELRTPLNAILGFSQILEADPQEPLGPNQGMAVSQILKGGEHLLALIDEVLDLASVESGKVALTIEAVEPGTIIESCLSYTKTQAESRDIRLINHASSKGLARVRADETRFRQGLLNLMSNAVKYNRDGGTVTVAANKTEDRMLRISVADTGPGIPVEKQNELFQPFSRLGPKNTGVPGTGIGLTITKRLVESMGGRVGFESKDGQGSVFWIDLPLAAPPT